MASSLTGLAATGGALAGFQQMMQQRFANALQARLAQIEEEKARYGFYGMYGRGLLAAQARNAGEQATTSQNDQERLAQAEMAGYGRFIASPYAYGSPAASGLVAPLGARFSAAIPAAGAPAPAVPASRIDQAASDAWAKFLPTVQGWASAPDQQRRTVRWFDKLWGTDHASEFTGSNGAWQGVPQTLPQQAAQSLSAGRTSAARAQAALEAARASALPGLTRSQESKNDAATRDLSAKAADQQSLDAAQTAQRRAAAAAAAVRAGIAATRGSSTDAKRRKKERDESH